MNVEQLEVQDVDGNSLGTLTYTPVLLQQLENNGQIIQDNNAYPVMYNISSGNLNQLIATESIPEQNIRIITDADLPTDSLNMVEAGKFLNKFENVKDVDPPYIININNSPVKSNDTGRNLVYRDLTLGQIIPASRIRTMTINGVQVHTIEVEEETESTKDDSNQNKNVTILEEVNTQKQGKSFITKQIYGQEMNSQRSETDQVNTGLQMNILQVNNQQINTQQINTQQTNTQQINTQQIETQQMNAQQMKTQQMNIQKMKTQQMNTQQMNTKRQTYTIHQNKIFATQPDIIQSNNKIAKDKTIQNEIQGKPGLKTKKSMEEDTIQNKILLDKTVNKSIGGFEARKVGISPVEKTDLSRNGDEKNILKKKVVESKLQQVVDEYVTRVIQQNITRNNTREVKAGSLVVTKRGIVQEIKRDSLQGISKGNLVGIKSENLERTNRGVLERINGSNLEEIKRGSLEEIKRGNSGDIERSNLNEYHSDKEVRKGTIEANKSKGNIERCKTREIKRLHIKDFKTVNIEDIKKMNIEQDVNIEDLKTGKIQDMECIEEDPLSQVKLYLENCSNPQEGKIFHTNILPGDIDEIPIEFIDGDMIEMIKVDKSQEVINSNRVLGIIQDGGVQGKILDHKKIQDRMTHNEVIHCRIRHDEMIEERIMQDGTIPDGLVRDRLLQDGRVQDRLIHDGMVQDRLIHDGMVQDRLVQDGMVRHRFLQDGTVQDRLIQDEMVQRGIIQDTMVQDRLIQGDLIHAEIIPGNIDIIHLYISYFFSNLLGIGLIIVSHFFLLELLILLLFLSRLQSKVLVVIKKLLPKL